MSNLFIDESEGKAGPKVMLATTAYDSPDAAYTFSIQRSRAALQANGIGSDYLLLSGNCHVDDARNSVVTHFLKSNCDALVFLDADVAWEANALIDLCETALDAPGFDIVGGVYPYRREDLRYAGAMPFRPLDGRTIPLPDGLLEVEGLPTGFMAITRRVLEAMAKEAPCFHPKADRRDTIPLIFERTMIDGIRWGGDMNFCRKARAAGFTVWAMTELRLGHVAKQVIWDSVAASFRRLDGTTLKHLCDLIRQGDDTIPDYTEAMRAVGNPWGAPEEVLIAAASLARRSTLPIIEAGSGLTTVVMAAANPKNRVWCMEHDPQFVLQTATMARQAGVDNIAICEWPLVDGWYKPDAKEKAMLPERFGLGLVDGPPRASGDRMTFFRVFGAACERIIADDADSPAYKDDLTAWAADNGRKTYFIDRAAIFGAEVERDAA